MERLASNRIRASVGAVLLSMSLAGCDDAVTADTPSGRRLTASSSTVSPTNSGAGGLVALPGTAPSAVHPPTGASSKVVTLSLTPPTESIDGTPLGAGLAGYRIYWGTSIGQYPNSATINNPGVATYVVENLSSATWHFVATALTTEGVESDFSDPVSVVL
jgi:hypothetical protein